MLPQTVLQLLRKGIEVEGVISGVKRRHGSFN